mgnify:CR=1 FL=1
MTPLRDKDRVVLTCIDNGKDDVQKITSETTLENHHVTYAFEKLQQLNLLNVSKPSGTVERIIDGQKRVFQHPKQAELTEKGEQYLEHSEEQDLDEYENLSHRELVKRVYSLEREITDLKQAFKTFQKQIQRKL